MSVRSFRKALKNKLRTCLSDYTSQKFSVWGKNIEFLDDHHFKRAWSKLESTAAAEYPGQPVPDYRWNAHILIWAAQHGLLLDGDFVECGVHRGYSSFAVCEYLNFETADRKFYLFDTYAGMPEERLTGRELQYAIEANKTHYGDTYDSVARTFSKYPNVQLVKGIVPDTLCDVKIEKIAYLSIDMNNARSEKAAVRQLWPMLAPSAIVVLDDYGWKGFRLQKLAIDALADEFGVPVYNLPTGQGLMIKPA